MRAPPSAIWYLALLAAFPAALPIEAQSVITTLAGTDWLFPGDGKPALQAPISSNIDTGVAVDQTGNLYIADPYNIMVMKVAPNGILTVVAGNGIFGYSGDGGPATSAALGGPMSVAVDTAGNLYIADGFNFVRKVNSAGIISTIAGTGFSGALGDGGPATQAQLNFPTAIAIGPAGEIYIADFGNNKIREIGLDGIMRTVAGTGASGYSGDGLAATSATLSGPTGVAVDPGGNLYISDEGNEVIRKVTPDGIINTFAGGGKTFRDGVSALSAAILPFGLAVNAAGDLFFGDYVSDRVRKISGGIITSMAGNGSPGYSGDGGPALEAMLNLPTGVALAADGSIYIADTGNARIRKAGADGNISTVAGNGLFRTGGDGGAATSAVLYQPTGLAVDSAGNFYISEQVHHRVRKVSPDGIIQTLAGTGDPGYTGDGGPAKNAKLFGPAGLAADAQGNVYIADVDNSVIRMVSAYGTITTVAGNGRFTYTGDGVPATSTALFAPFGVAVDALGSLYIADTDNERIRRVDAATGIITTIAGNGEKGYTGDGQAAVNARLGDPRGIALDSAGNVYFAEYANNVIRKVTVATGIISTVAGNGSPGYSGDGRLATAAMLNTPTSVVVDSAFNLYVADYRNHAVRLINPAGIISTLAGTGIAGLSGDGGPPGSAMLFGPSDVKIDSAGNVLIADEFNNRVRGILSAAQSFQLSSSALSYAGQVSGATPPVQHIAVRGSIPGLPFTVTLPGKSWITVTPTSGVTPASLDVTCTPADLGEGSVQAMVTVQSPVTLPAQRSFSVAFNVAAASAQKLGVSPQTLSFTATQGSGSITQVLKVDNEGGGTFSYSATSTTSLDATGAAAGASWLSISAASGQVTAVAPSPISVTVDPGKLAPGTYRGQITVLTSGGQQTVVPVTLTVNAVPQRIVLSSTGMTFTAVAGGGVSPPQTLTILNTGSGSMPWSVTVVPVSGAASAAPGSSALPASWLQVTPASGASSASQGGGVAQIGIGPAGLAAGAYYGQVQVTSPTADNSPQVVSVVMNMLPAGSDPGPVVQPSALVFTAVAGGPSPGSQNLAVANLSAHSIAFTSGALTDTGGSWFVSLPVAATVVANQLARIVVQPNTSGLAPGVYHGALTLGISGGVSRSVNLLLVVSVPPLGQPTGYSVAGRFTPQQGPWATQSACVVTKLLPVFTSLSADTTAAAGWPSRMVVQAVDDCGAPMIDGSVVAEFSNNEPSQVLVSGKDGTWSGTWLVRDSATSVTIHVTAQIPEGQLRGVAEVTIGAAANVDPPLVFAGGVVNSATFAANGPLAPGGLISIFGQHLSQNQQGAPQIPLGTQLAGTLVTLAGHPLPLLFASDGQVNAMIPYGIPVNAHYQLVVSRGSSISAPEPVTLAGAQPAVFTSNQSGSGQGIILDLNNHLVQPGNPAHANDVVVMYCESLGDVNPAVPAGTAAPGSPPAMTANPVTVTIGGVDAAVQFAGLAPGFAGLYQLNVVVPGGVAAGDAVPVVVSVAGQASPPVTLAVQ